MINKNGLLARTSSQSKLVRYVLLGSNRGAYGGPFDTATSQSLLVPGLRPLLLFGHFAGEMPDVKDLEVSSQRVRHIFGAKSFFDVGSFAHFWNLWKCAKCKISHISFARALGPIIFSLFCKIRRSAYILQPHGMLTSRSSKAFSIFDFLVTKPIMRGAASVIALTEIEARDLLAWDPILEGKIEIIGNPPMFGLKVAQSNSTYRNSALFAARLHPRKKVLDFATAAKLAFEFGWGERYIVLGPDEGDLSALLSLASEVPTLNYEGATDSTGVILRLKEVGVFVLCSQDEPWGNVLVASLTLGKPVVITKSSALSDLVFQFSGGIVVDDNSPDQIAKAIHEILQDVNYKRYSEGAINMAKACLSSDSVKVCLENVYLRAGIHAADRSGSQSDSN